MQKVQNSKNPRMVSTQIEQVASSIDGWMTQLELRWLMSTAASLGEKTIAVEIGAYKGRSSIAIGRSLDTNSILYCVDSWLGDPYDTDDLRDDLYWTWLRNLFQHAFACPIVPIRQPSARAVRLFPPASIDWVFIDGSHLYEHVSQDISLWTSKVRSGGIISGHDYVADCPGVVKAVDSAFPSHAVEDKIWWVRI